MDMLTVLIAVSCKMSWREHGRTTFKNTKCSLFHKSHSQEFILRRVHSKHKVLYTNTQQHHLYQRYWKLPDCQAAIKGLNQRKATSLPTKDGNREVRGNMQLCLQNIVNKLCIDYRTVHTLLLHLCKNIQLHKNTKEKKTEHRKTQSMNDR